jgi:hypothetical protein
MPSKKTLKKQNQKLRAELTELRGAALKLVDAIQDGPRKEIDEAAETVRDLIPGAPWTVQRIFRLHDQLWSKRLGDVIDKALTEPPSFASGGQVTAIADIPDWAKTSHNVEVV